MAFQSASLIRPAPVTALAGLYALAGGVCILTGLFGVASQAEYRIGELMLPAAAARGFLLVVGAGMSYIGWGFLQLRSVAWHLYVYTLCVALVLELLWIWLGGPRYLLYVAVDAALLAYVYRQRSYFTH